VSAVSESPERMIAEAVQGAVGSYPVLLWGSRATGEATQTSDWDLFVVLPAHKVPLAARRLPHLSEQLGRRVGASVSVNPLPAFALRRASRKLSLWKLRRESRVLAAPPGFELAPATEAPTSAATAFSYLLSAAVYLIEDLDPPALKEAELPADVGRGARKALLHTAQLRLLRKGAYASRLDQALERLGDPALTAMGAAPTRSQTWFAIRGEVLTDLPPAPHGRMRALIVNAQYGALTTLAGAPKWRPALSGKPIDERIAGAVVALLRAVGSSGRVSGSEVAEAWRLLPSRLRGPRERDWAALRDIVVREWAQAHPLVGL
jgi:predicted nucleotidyltransferase